MGIFVSVTLTLALSVKGEGTPCSADLFSESLRQDPRPGSP